ncbi:MAG: hypothetical protein HY811_02895 [Planctomycetes bacterium]|nr:hypothetical protein [Planctomycetota bacterium]
MPLPIITSPETAEYNCIAWAAEENTRWWEPDPMDLYYWPDNIPRELTLEAFREAYKTLGYERCYDANLEERFQKIAIYIKNKRPTHAARQLNNGNWTSKLGPSFDIEHEFIKNWSGVIYWLDGEPHDLSGYGKLGCILKRPVSLNSGNAIVN